MIFLVVEDVEEVMKECSRKEDEKMWEFSIEKSKWMCQSNGKKSIQDIDVEVKQGKIGRAAVYKYLGNMVNEKGNMDDQLKFMEEKVNGIVRDGRKMCSCHRIGKYEMEAKKVVYHFYSICL